MELKTLKNDEIIKKKIEKYEEIKSSFKDPDQEKHSFKSSKSKKKEKPKISLTKSKKKENNKKSNKWERHPIRGS